jgi:cytosine/adenosine deaminase-related metal-dependent hydrolase
VKIVHDTTVITPGPDGIRTLPGHSLVFEAGRVVELGPATQYAERIATREFDEVIPGERHVLIPGLVNTHHHLYQSLTRCLPAVQDERLFDWLPKLYKRWRHLDCQAVNLAAKVNIAELLLSGCTTTSDHFYIFPRGGDVKIEAVLDAAEQLGIRLHLCRGAMTLGQSHGGLPPDDCVEDDADVLAECQRVLNKHHDPSDHAMCRIDLAPCSPFNCTPELLRDTVALARAHDNVLLHTHLAETLDEQRFCLERYNCRPVRLLADLDFLGPDVYLAHCVHLDDNEIALLASTGTGVSHNPSSNMRLGSGIAPLRKLLDAGIRVGLGVDGSSSNDAGNLLAEARQALLAARALQGTTETRRHGEDDWGLTIDDCELQTADKAAEQQSEIRNPKSDIRHPPLFPVVDAFKLATVGGAACLNRPVLGHLNPGAAADFAMFRSDDIALAGAIAQDPLAALILCAAPRAEHVYVAGRQVVRDGRIAALDQNKLADQMNELVAARFRGP